jgi:hypothetical protein
VPIELGSDVELDEVYAQERRAWAEAQRNDPALRTLFSHAHGIHQKNKSIQKREPSIDSDGRLFVAFGHDHARRLVVPSERAPALIGATSPTTRSRQRRRNVRRAAEGVLVARHAQAGRRLVRPLPDLPVGRDPRGVRA